MGLKWGVWVEGSSVELVADGLSAFRREKAWHRVGAREAVAVWSRDGVRWVAVGPGDSLRPDPVPPPQDVWWRRMWRGGKFRRRVNGQQAT